MFMFMFLFMAIWVLGVMPWAFLYIREDMDSVHNKALSTTNLIISMVGAIFSLGIGALTTQSLSRVLLWPLQMVAC